LAQALLAQLWFAGSIRRAFTMAGKFRSTCLGQVLVSGCLLLTLTSIHMVWHNESWGPAFVRPPCRGNLPRVVRHDASQREAIPALDSRNLQVEHEFEVTKERLNMLCLSFLQQVGNVEEMIEAGACHQEADGSIDIEGFTKLIQKLELEITQEETKYLFNEMDSDADGSIDPKELRATIRNSGAITAMYSEGLQSAGLTVLPALVTAALFTYFQGVSSGIDFLTGYVVEDSLSVDNIFVFLTLFKYFKVPPSLQTYCLNLGIVGAVILRAFFIFAGLAAVKAFEPLLLVFSALLLYSSYTVLFSSDEESEDEGGDVPEVVQNILDQLPTTNKFVGDKLTVQSSDGRVLVTPLALCIIAVELSDILFAVDSVPAVFAVTNDPLIVYTSNILAILGLRSIYQVLAIAVSDLVYLEKAVAVILGFVGFKLGAGVAGVEIASTTSLAFIVGVLFVGVVASLQMQDAQDTEEEEFTRRRKKPIEKAFDNFSQMWSAVWKQG